MASAILGAWGGTAEAASAICPSALGFDGEITVTRQWDLTVASATSVACYDYGLVNLNDAGEDALFPSPPFSWDAKDKEDSAGNGDFLQILSTSNSQTDIKFVAGTGNYAVLFKFGSGSGDPDWVVFLINGVPNNALGDLTLISGVGNGLSHHTTWFDAVSPPQTPTIPEPASLLLMGSGLAGIGARMRRRAKKA